MIIANTAKKNQAIFFKILNYFTRSVGLYF